MISAVSFVFLLAVAHVALVNSYGLPASSKDYEIMSRIGMENPASNMVFGVYRRWRRNPVPERVCGGRLMTKVVHVCKGPCTAVTGMDIATHCCSNECNDAYVKKACCP
ncbi:unnamed protein product [Caenorhabditis sp. 36 PRJEB53466]|nr:unnamed protein product [Caenorhabditis sp. 36 PRJEB53466]